MFDTDRYSHEAFERVKRWFSIYLKYPPTDEGMLRVMYDFFSNSDPVEATWCIILIVSNGGGFAYGKTMARLYHKYEKIGLIHPNQNSSKTSTDGHK